MKMISIIMVDCLLFFVSMVAMAQIAQRDSAPLNPNSKMPLQNGTPDLTSPGPWDSDVLVYRVNANGKIDKLGTFERAGVPTIARMNDGRLIAAYQYFPENDAENFDKVAARFSSDEGETWTEPQVIKLSGLPNGMRFPFDPTLVPLPDGQIRLYFTSLLERQFDTQKIFSAISRDGINYTLELGARFSLTGRPVIDCAVVSHNGLFHLYSPDNGAIRRPGELFAMDEEQNDQRPKPGVGYHAISNDGLNFTRAEDVYIDGDCRWLGNAQSDGKLITFFGTGNPGEFGIGQPRSSVWISTSEDGQHWERPQSLPIMGGDPGAVATSDGGWIIVITGGPRPGTPSANRSRNDQKRPRPNADGPWNHKVLLATSRDGLSWTVNQQVLIEQASVPELFAGPDGKPVILFVDASGKLPPGVLGAIVQESNGSWKRGNTNLEGADPNVVRLDDGTYRAYTKAKDGAINVHTSKDGLNWRWLDVAFSDKRYPQSTDPDVFKTPSGWVMLISLGPRLLRCTSPDGIKFVAGEIIDIGGSVSDTVTVKDGWRTFFHVNANPRTNSKMVIRSAFTKDGRSWKVEDGDRVRATEDSPSRLGVADPAPLQLPDGSWLMAIKSFREFVSSDRFPQRQSGQIRVITRDSQYAVAPSGKPGHFITGQDADLMLGGIDFNNSGGPLLFNHPTGLASDGKSLLLTDRWNNRVLIWTRLPKANTPPDVVLGQKDFTTNNPGLGRENLNWPGNVTITPDGTKLAVTDTNNDRILIWNSFPSENGTAADVVLELPQLSGANSFEQQRIQSDQRPQPDNRARPDNRFRPGRQMQRFGWPWGVWTNGQKFAVVCTHGSAVLIWNSIPTQDNQQPDLVLHPPDTGTPRNITSDGTFFALSDHNHGKQSRPATAVWQSAETIP